MNVNILTNAVLSMATLILVCTNPLPGKPRLLHRGILFAVLFFMSILVFPRIGQAGTIVSLSIIFIFLMITQKGHRLLACICSLCGYIISIMINYILLIGADRLLGLEVSALATTYLLPFSLLFMAVSGIATWLLGYFLRNKIKIQDIQFNRLNILAICLNLAICVVLFVFNIIYGDRLGYPAEVVSFNGILFIAYFVLSSVLFSFSIFSIKKEEAAKHKLERLEALEGYTQNLESLYNQMRAFKHDYTNILTTMSCFLEEKDYEGLHTYFNERILPTGQELGQKSYSVGILSNMGILELKSLLYTKVIQAITQELSLSVDIPYKVERVSMDMIDLTRILGIFLDNALEAAAISDKRELYIGILQEEDRCIFLIKNSCDTENLSMGRLGTPGYSTKGENRGIGLSNVNKLLEKYPSALLNTEYKEHIFSQKLEIPCER
ncbi:sensor histidine kinase [Lactonifactor longoviformis]|uniref:sensor histidine kinase n=1 Tax=Lactonifactor longoviformis TaxID=341220 RepID=UPI0036F41D0A